MNNNRKHSEKTPAKQGVETASPEPLKIGASTPYDFSARNLTAYGGLLPVATMLEKLGFEQLVEETLSISRVTRVMPVYRFVLAMVLALYVGFSRLHHLRFLEREPMLTGILKILRLPPQCTFWRFLASLHLTVAGQILRLQQTMSQRVWQAAHVDLKTITLDTDTTVHTLFGDQMGGRKSYNPKNRGKKSYQPILTFLAETREYVAGELRNGDRPTGKQIARHLEGVFAAVPKSAETIYARADSGFYCNEAVEAYEKAGARFIISARKTSRLVEGAENLIKEAKNDAGLTAHPSGRWSMNCIYFQLAMLAYNLNCWLMLFNREEEAKVETLGHTTLATARLKFLFLAARIWRHAGRVGVSYSDHYAERSLFERLMTRLRSVATNENGFVPVISIALRC